MIEADEVGAEGKGEERLKVREVMEWRSGEEIKREE